MENNDKTGVLLVELKYPPSQYERFPVDLNSWTAVNLI